MPFEIPFNPKDLERLRREQDPERYAPKDKRPEQRREVDDERWYRRPEMPAEKNPPQTGENVTIIQFGKMMEDDESGDRENRRAEK